MEDENIIIPTNEFQTSITKEFLSQYPEEVVTDFMDYITNVTFIKNLISPTRRRAKDMPKDSKGRIIVDLENPHILENMDYFREMAIFYKEHECYTYLIPNNNPKSEYRKLWDREKDRCYNGCVRPDGEWITGYMYWYLNYCPIMLVNTKKGSRRADRVEELPEIWEGIYWRFHYLEKARNDGKHAIELAKRGCSKSYSLAAIMSHNLILGETSEVNHRVTTILTAYQKEYLAAKDGTLSKFEPMIDYISKKTPFPRLRLNSSMNDMFWKMGYIDETGAKKGSLNTVMGVSSKDDSDKLRGKRGYILFEEMGSFPNLLAIYDTVRYGVEEGEYTYGLIYLVGTAAEDASDFSSAKSLLYNTSGYNIEPINNVFDKPRQGRPTFGFFFPAYVNIKGCYNKDGVSDVVKAVMQILMNRYRAKYSSEPDSVIRVIAEMPITPAEAIIKIRAAYFPIQALTERVLQLDSDPEAYSDVWVGSLIQNSDGKVEFRPTEDTPIRDFPLKDNTAKGAIEFYSMPEKDSSGNVFNDRYIIGHDPVDNDQADSHSLASTFVFDLFTDRIVAEKTGRNSYADENFEEVRLLCIFYNAKCLYESNKKGLFAYFSKMNCVHMLADTPEYLRDKQLVKYSSFGSNQKGVNASAAINNFANDRIKSWLMKPMRQIVKNDKGKEEEITKPILYSIMSRALLQELINFAPEVNVDRVRSLGMVMLYRQQYIILYGDNMNEKSREKTESNYLGKDDFFTRNYDNR